MALCDSRIYRFVTNTYFDYLNAHSERNGAVKRNFVKRTESEEGIV